VDRIVPESPAAKAGVRVDDLLITVDAQAVTSCQHATKLMERYEQDASLRVAFLRDGALIDVTLQASKPADQAKE
jgi:S1-C subfamily serine protease